MCHEESFAILGETSVNGDSWLYPVNFHAYLAGLKPSATQKRLHFTELFFKGIDAPSPIIRQGPFHQQSIIKALLNPRVYFRKGPSWEK